MKALLAGLLLLCCLSGCGYLVSEEDAVEAAERSGLSRITVTSAHQLSPRIMGGCSQDDSAGFEIAATNTSGKRITAVVCCGWFLKACTVRY